MEKGATLTARRVKIRDGKVANRPIYLALAVTVDGTRDILGPWAGDGGEGAKFWLQVLTELKNRGVDDACMVVCDGLKGLPAAIAATWPLAVVQMRDPPAAGLVPVCRPAALGRHRQSTASGQHRADRGRSTREHLRRKTTPGSRPAPDPVRPLVALDQLTAAEPRRSHISGRRSGRKTVQRDLNLVIQSALS
jgi:Transposase, Mutator family